MNNTTVFLIICLSINWATAQPFSLELHSDNENYIQDIVEMEGKGFLAIHIELGLQSVVQDFTIEILSIGYDGNVKKCKTLDFTPEYKFSGRAHFVRNYPREKEVFFYGTLNDPDYSTEKQPYFARIDEELNIVWDTIWGEIGKKEIPTAHILKGDSIFFLGTITNGSFPAIDYTPFIVKTDLDGNLQAFKTLDKLKNELIGNESLVDAGNKFHLHDLSLDSFFSIAADNFQNTKTIAYYPNRQPHKYGITHKITPEKYFLTGNSYRIVSTNPFKVYDYLSVALLDTAGAVLDTFSFGQTQDFDVDNGFHNIDSKDSNHIFICGYEKTEVYYPTSDWLGLYSFRLDKTLNWQRFFNLGRNFYPQVLKATSDGGVIMAGYQYYTPNNTPGDPDGDRNALILKFDAYGNISSEELPVDSKPILVYPNPSNGLFYINLGMLNEIRCMIFDQKGLLVKDCFVDNILDLSRVDAGVYSCSFYSKNGLLISTEQIIKSE